MQEELVKIYDYKLDKEIIDKCKEEGRQLTSKDVEIYIHEILRNNDIVYKNKVVENWQGGVKAPKYILTVEVYVYKKDEAMAKEVLKNKYIGGKIMRIGIDIDDVITDTSASMKEYISKYDENGEISEHMEDVMRGDMSNPNIKKFFADNSAKIFGNAKLKENADNVIQRLLNKGHEIFVITSRGEIKFKDSEQITLQYFKLNNIKYTKILFNSFEKAKICKDYKIDLMIDDSEKYCREIEKENIKSILFTSEVNKDISTNVERINNWLELEERINKMSISLE